MDLLVYQDAFLSDLLRTKVLAAVPETWTPLQRANAICELQYPENVSEKWGLSSLAFLALLRAMGKVELAVDLLLAGWCPHEGFELLSPPPPLPSSISEAP